jgi:hypothetical protein
MKRLNVILSAAIVALAALLAVAAPATQPAVKLADWTSDRRPVGVVMLAGSDQRTAANPRGWRFEWHLFLDARQPDYKAKFAEALDKEGDLCVRLARESDCQSVLIWDLEGQEFEHSEVTYVGDPNILPPEMAQLAADAATVDPAYRHFYTVARSFCAKFVAAGIRVGGTIRPTICVQTPYGPRQVIGDPLTVLTAKVNWARQVLGWRDYYVDSSYLAYAVKPDRPFNPIGADVYRKLAERFPDCRFMPEGVPEDYATVPTVTAWRPFRNGSPVVPGGRGVLPIEYGTDLTGANRAKILLAHRLGCLPMVRVDAEGYGQWNPKVLALYAEATKPKPATQPAN